MKSYLEIRNKITKLNAYYVINQGEYMNNYKNELHSQGVEYITNEKFQNVESLVFMIKRFFDTINEFSNFEIEELKRIQEIKNFPKSVEEDIQDYMYLSDKDNIVDFLKYAFDRDTYSQYLQLKADNYKINHSLNFELKSLIIQKKNAIENYDVAKAIKIGDKITQVSLRIKNQKDKIAEINNQIKMVENDFYNKYLTLLNDVSDHVGTKKSSIIDSNKYEEKVYRYFVIQKLIFNFTKNEYNNLQDIVYVLKTDSSLKKLLEDVIDDLLLELSYVGTNSKSSD